MADPATFSSCTRCSEDLIITSIILSSLKLRSAPLRRLQTAGRISVAPLPPLFLSVVPSGAPCRWSPVQHRRPAAPPECDRPTAARRSCSLCAAQVHRPAGCARRGCPEVCVYVCVSVPVLLFWFGWTDRLHISSFSQDSSQLFELCEHFLALSSSSALIDFVVDGRGQTKMDTGCLPAGD